MVAPKIGAADHTNTAVVKSGSDHTEHRYDNTQGGACRMGGHVENFFSFGVIRQNTFCQFFALQSRVHLQTMFC